MTSFGRPNTFAEFRDLVSQYDQPADWRLGQTAFNLLAEFKPRLTSKLVLEAPGSDPFYVDELLERFWVWTEQHWDHEELDPSQVSDSW